MELENGFPIRIGIPEKADSLITYCVCSDGIYIQKKVADGFVVVKQDTVPGIAKGVEKISIMPRKVPMSIFWETLRFFKFVEQHFGNVGMEAYVLIGYNTEADEFILYVPKQEVGAASVTYDPNEFYSEYPGSYIVMDIHSHTSKMSAFFSGVDDRDDNRDRYSGVFGRIDQVDIYGRPNPEFKIRFSTMGHRTEFKTEDLFELNDEVHVIDCENVIQRVTRPVVSNYSRPGLPYYAGGYYSGESSYNSGGVKIYGAKNRRNISSPDVGPENTNGFGSTDFDWEKYYEEVYGDAYKDPYFVSESTTENLAGHKKIRNFNKEKRQKSNLHLDDKDVKSWYQLLKEKRIRDYTFSISELMGA